MDVLKEEFPRTVVDEDSERNWSQLEADQRKRCVKALQTYLEAEIDREVLDKWRGQYENGMRIGSDEPHFHFGPGMAIRNILRLEVDDNNLPWVDQPGGKSTKNWDDYYLAALREALGLDRAT